MPLLDVSIASLNAASAYHQRAEFIRTASDFDHVKLVIAASAPKPVAVANDDVVTIADQQWVVQSGAPDGVAVARDGSVVFRVKTGERANFDPPRKIRAEFAGVKRYEKGEDIQLQGVFTHDPSTVITGTDWCSIVQVHQADSRDANGQWITASPMFAMGLFHDRSGRLALRVAGETGRGVPAQNVFSPQRVLGEITGLRLGVAYTFRIHVIDGHGERGRISVWINDRAIVDRSDIVTGYEYVDRLADTLYAGKPQPTGSYLKIGLYAGKFTGHEPPADVTIGSAFRNLAAPTGVTNK